MSSIESIAEAIGRATGRLFQVEDQRAVAGGCINSAKVLEGNGQRYFLKINEASRLDMFEAEAAGLDELVASNTICAPRPIVSGQVGGQAYLVMEYLDLGGRGGDTSDALLGRNLALMHRITQPDFGWRRDNTIGSTPQINHPESDWVIFFREHRLRFQLKLAARNGDRPLLLAGEQLLEVLPAFFTDYRPLPSLLHGDLWGGNHSVLRDGTPVIFDPAVYYGDREADLAMTELFGGFGDEFYRSYQDAWPMDPGYRTRKDLYNLYHVLNHFNLFGGGYGAQARRLIGALLSQVR